MLKKLQHPFVVPFYGIYVYDDASLHDVPRRYFLVSEFAEHGSLDTQSIKDFGPQPDGAPLELRFKWVRTVGG